jgi:histidinol-phosphate/aromatic aminotransferase/cobyric acid decarboxylase-like protein
MARKAIIDRYPESNRYPDDYIPLLRKKIATHWVLLPKIFCWVQESSEIIGLVCMHVSRKKNKVITAEAGI